jgi:hypothetical protein
MNMGLKNWTAMLAVTVILLTCIQANMKSGFSADSGGEIDLFTQKTPFDGKGPNMTSDAFGPGEVVILCALVTYNEAPLQKLPVAFYGEGPDNSSFCLTDVTNASGLAAVNFTIAQKCDGLNEVFGEWFILANVRIGDNVYQDTLTFRVDWIVKLVSAKTIDANLAYRDKFGIEGDVGVEISLRNVARNIKNATFAIVLEDETQVPVSYLEINDFEVQPDEKLVFLYCKLNVPKWSRVGKATVLVSALTASPAQNGVPYCPAVSAEFLITINESLEIALYDAAIIKVIPSANSVRAGEPVYLGVTVRNEGTEIESFNVSAYYNGLLIGTFEVVTLAPYSSQVLNFTFDTSAIDTGGYTITVSIPFLPKEADLTDNNFTDGVIHVLPKLPIIVHDIAVTDVAVSTSSLYVGELLEINVSLANKGTENETFNVKIYYDHSLIGDLDVNDLEPNTQLALIFIWNTSSAQEGYYRISASALLSSDINVLDNTFINGIVHVKARPSQPLMHNVAILDLHPSSTLLYRGEIDGIYVLIKNRGNFTESFNVKTYYNQTLITTFSVIALPPDSTTAMTFVWNTTNVSEGLYELSAYIEPVPDEIDTLDNNFTDGIVEVRSPVHDISVLNIVPASSQVFIGELLEINVTVKNDGNQIESFNVTLFYDSNIVGALSVDHLPQSNTLTLIFHWNTSNVLEGNYTLSALAHPVQDETDTGDNYLTDGSVRVSSMPKGWYVPEWIWWLLLPLLILLIIVLLILLHHRKRRKDTRANFYSGWTAWYYGYDLRRRSIK